MANKKTVALTKEQYKEIIETIRTGFTGFRPNPRVAMALILEANLGVRVSDITNLKLNDIIKDGERYRLDISEIKTEKRREFTVPIELYQYIRQYCIDNDIKSNANIFDITERAVQKQLKVVCDWLGYKGIGTHSFRKFFATNIYINNNYNVVLVQQLLQHSSPAITQKYIGIGSKELEQAIQGNLNLL